MPWYRGPTLLQHLETVPVANDRNYGDARFPVQYVVRPHLDYRGFAGQIASGIFKKGDTVMVLPSRKTSRIRAIDTFRGERDAAFAPMSVTVRLEDEVDVSRGDMLVHLDNAPTASERFEAMMVWMSERPLDRDKSYLLKHTTRVVRAEIEAVLGSTDLETLSEVPSEGLGLNDIGRVRVRCHRPVFFDPYEANRSTGAFIIIDSLSNNTVAAGMILAADTRSVRSAALGQKSQVSAAERRERLGQAGRVVMLVGASAAARAELAYALERRLFDLGKIAMVVEEAESVRVGEKAGDDFANRVARAGLVVICPREAAGPVLSQGAPDAPVVVEVATAEAAVSNEPSSIPKLRVSIAAGADSAADVVAADLEKLGVFKFGA
jgi:hypothetical protein